MNVPLQFKSRDVVFKGFQIWVGQTCASAILGSLNPAPYWKFFFQMLFRLFQSWNSQILAKHAWIANWQYLLVLDKICKTLKKIELTKIVFI